VSVFSDIDSNAWVASNELAFAIRDGFPVTSGHVLVIPKREVADWFDATPQERQALLELVDKVKSSLDASEDPPDGYNIGMNLGAAAGQTVFHLHLHVIPRRHGDMPDPRGGVRHVIPDKGNYLDD
jgi:diadenosine tetraphosphate (Ap4A) HIT family hydrolase